MDTSDDRKQHFVIIHWFNGEDLVENSAKGTRTGNARLDFQANLNRPIQPRRIEPRSRKSGAEKILELVSYAP